MLTLWRGSDRGVTDEVGVRRLHQFSSGSFFDAERMGFGTLRVIDELCLAPGATLASERRANMEILTWVFDGKVELIVGDASQTLVAGGFARTSAGSGIECAMRNRGDVPARCVQPWLQPTVVNAIPQFETKQFSDAELRRGIRRIAAMAGIESDVALRADASAYVARGIADEALSFRMPPPRQAWLQILRGKVGCGDLSANAGDGVAISGENVVALRVREDAEVLLIELP